MRAAAAKPCEFAAFDLLATMVAVVARDGALRFVNAEFEAACGLSRRSLLGMSLQECLQDAAPMADAIAAVAGNRVASARLDALLRPLMAGVAPPQPLPVHAIVSQLERDGGQRVLVELIEIQQQTRQDREERTLDQVRANKELLRNLAHEVKNPLGGIRGAAQLLGMEVQDKALRDYTQVIVHEADRLQALVDRLLAPHRHAPVVGDVNIHEVCERVRSLILAEFAEGLAVQRDYDISLPEFRGDRAQLIQAVLNIAHNAAQALLPRMQASGDARIVLRTRAARQVTIDKQRWRLALELQVEDNGPGIPEPLRDRIFHPLVSGREGGSGLGLTLAQTFVQQHQGMVDCHSAPGRTVFRLTLPLP